MSDQPAPDAGAASGDGPSGAEPPPTAPRVYPYAVPVGVTVAVVLVLLDQATKELAEALLTPGRFVPWLGSSVGWQLVYNPGGAFGLPAPHWLFLVVTAGVVVLVARVLPRAPSLVAALAYGMLLAGAVGNVLDRLLRPGGTAFGSGWVVDFVAWGSFPRFNVADSAITVGFVLLVIALWQEEREAEALAPAATERAGDTADEADTAAEQADEPADEADAAAEPADDPDPEAGRDQATGS